MKRNQAIVLALVLGLGGAGLTTGLASAAAATAPSGSQPCSWQLVSNPDTVNAAYPDLDATYWIHLFVPVPGQRLVISGRYPVARYFSFHTYESTGIPLDSAYDAQINPDRGSSNPFRATPRPGTQDHYTETVQFANAPSHPAANTIYTGPTAQGTTTPTSALIYRVYVPKNPTNAAGGVPLPRLTLKTSSGTTVARYGACLDPSVDTGGAVNQAVAGSNYPASAPAPPAARATDPVSWGRAFSNPYAGFFGNQQNAYLTGSISRHFGQLVVIHAKAATFPNTRAGIPAYRPSQVRYWSICENSSTTRVISCAADYSAAIRDGYYTYVISDPADRPRNATARNGVTWLPWGSGVFPNALLIYRNMIPAPGFKHAVQEIGKTDSPQRVMGAYYPRTAYCSTATFQAGGWRACLKGS
jgi:hypothetical protein